MKMRAIWVLVLAIVCGTSAAIGMNHLRASSDSGSVDTVSTLVAGRDIPRGSMLTADMLETKEWPKSMLPKKAVTQEEEVIGRAAAVAIAEGDVVTEGKLASKSAGRGVAALIPAGMRAYTIQTSKAAANVAGFVMPGNRVDVLLSLHSFQVDGTGGGSSTTLLQAVEILAVDQRLDAPAENKVDPKDLQSVTLLVTSEQAGLLDLGQNLGQLNLSLRNLDDKTQVPTTPATLAMLHSGTTPKAANAPEKALVHEVSATRPERRTTTIYTLRGTQPGSVTLSE
jgi:pilus assembly protein CpaB